MEKLTQHQTDVIGELQSKIEILENENLLLKKRLDEAGIPYADIVTDNANESMGIIYSALIDGIGAAINRKRMAFDVKTVS